MRTISAQTNTDRLAVAEQPVAFTVEREHTRTAQHDRCTRSDRRHRRVGDVCEHAGRKRGPHDHRPPERHVHTARCPAVDRHQQPGDRRQPDHGGLRNAGDERTQGSGIPDGARAGEATVHQREVDQGEVIVRSVLERHMGDLRLMRHGTQRNCTTRDETGRQARQRGVDVAREHVVGTRRDGHDGRVEPAFRHIAMRSVAAQDEHDVRPLLVHASGHRDGVAGPPVGRLVEHLDRRRRP